MSSQNNPSPLIFPFIFCARLGLVGILFLGVILALQIYLGLQSTALMEHKLTELRTTTSLPDWLLINFASLVPYFTAFFFSLFGTIAVANAVRLRFFSPNPPLLAFIETYPTAWRLFSQTLVRSFRVIFYVALPALAMGILYREFVSKLEVASAYWLYVAGCISVFGIVLGRAMPLFLSPFVALATGSAPFIAMQNSHHLARGQKFILSCYSVLLVLAVLLTGACLGRIIVLPFSSPSALGIQWGIALLGQIYSVAAISFCIIRAALPPSSPRPPQPPPSQGPTGTKVAVEKVWVE